VGGFCELEKGSPNLGVLGLSGWGRAIVIVTVTALSRIERNNAEPRPKTRRKLAQALGVAPVELVE
jgi:transcriptional regulator with XRE-family HTH domain